MTEFLKRMTKADIRNTITMVWVVMSFIVMFHMLKKAIPVENKEIVLTIGGIIIGKLVDIMNYYFGQSKTEVDDKKKDQL